MNKVLKNSWALFLGMGFIMMAYGFQGSLLGVRAVKEEFSLTSTGFMMSGYFVGYFIGAATIPSIISRVGHIRVFAAFASLASLVILIHSIIINPFIWFLLRVLTGISMVCIYTVAESWLNDRSSNKNRGSVLSVYMVILYGTMGMGMFLLNCGYFLNCGHSELCGYVLDCGHFGFCGYALNCGCVLNCGHLGFSGYDLNFGHFEFCGR